MPPKSFVRGARTLLHSAPFTCAFVLVTSCVTAPIDTGTEDAGSGSGGMPVGGAGGSVAGVSSGGVSGTGFATGGFGATAGAPSGGVSGSATGGFSGTGGDPLGGTAGLGATGGGGISSGGTGGMPTGGTAGTPTGGTAGQGGEGLGGTGGAPGGKGGSGGTAGGGKAVEDDGTDCQVPSLPAAGSLPTIARLPDPFTKLSGMRMTTKAEWRCRRAEIKRQAETYAYGTKPPKPTVTGSVSNTNITVNVSDMGRSASFSASVTLPSGTGPFPAVVILGGLGADTATIRAEGVATINYDPYALGREGTGRANKQGAFYTLYGSTSTTGLLVAWSWGVSRIIDVIEMYGGNILRADGVGVTGCSRFGKGAFTVGVFDQRVALTMPIESGTAGVPIWRGVPGEGAQSLSSAYGEQPWFGDAFTSFTGTPTRAPIDTHELVAMIAPRGLLIMDNPHIANLGPRSAHVAALGGAEVYRALGAFDAISYHSNVASGTHCAVRSEWTTPLRNVLQRFLKKTSTAAGTITARSNATGNLADWRDWTTPTLN